MDIKWTILLMILLYVVPELFKRRPKKYEYPDIPQPVPEPIPGPAPGPVNLPAKASVKETAWTAPQLKAKEGLPMSEVAPPMQVLQLQESSSWQGGVSHTAVINGFIFAEVLQPPRARRPFECMQPRLGQKKHN